MSAAGEPMGALGEQRDAVLEPRPLYRFFRAGEKEARGLKCVSLTPGLGELVADGGPSGAGNSTPSALGSFHSITS
jgi:hypothetical protein